MWLNPPGEHGNYSKTPFRCRSKIRRKEADTFILYVISEIIGNTSFPDNSVATANHSRLDPTPEIAEGLTTKRLERVG